VLITKPEIRIIRVTEEADRLIEEAARGCYSSEISPTDEKRAQFIASLKRRKHLSPFEHASATFQLKNVSRALTHQLVRHRLASFSQQSQRYTEPEVFSYVVPPRVNEDEIARELFMRHRDFTMQAYDMLRQRRGILKEDARFLLPNATPAEIVFTANFRQLLYMIQLRTEASAQWEIRRVFEIIHDMMSDHYPSIFGSRDISTVSA